MKWGDNYCCLKDHLFLKMGITLASLCKSGKMPVRKDIFRILVRYVEKNSLHIFMIEIGRLLGPRDLFKSRDKMIL